MEPFTSFALKRAAGIVLEIGKSYSNDVDNQIAKAHKNALKDWSKNAEIRRVEGPKFLNELRSIVGKMDKAFYEKKNPQFIAYLVHFEKRLAEQQAAYNYLKSEYDKAKDSNLVKSLTTIESIVSEIQDREGGGVDPHSP